MKVQNLGFELGEKGADDVSPRAGKHVSSQKPRSHPTGDKASAIRSGRRGGAEHPTDRRPAVKELRGHLGRGRGRHEKHPRYT